MTLVRRWIRLGALLAPLVASPLAFAQRPARDRLSPTQTQVPTQTHEASAGTIVEPTGAPSQTGLGNDRRKRAGGEMPVEVEKRDQLRHESQTRTPDNYTVPDVDRSHSLLPPTEQGSGGAGPATPSQAVPPLK